MKKERKLPGNDDGRYKVPSILEICGDVDACKTRSSKKRETEWISSESVVHGLNFSIVTFKKLQNFMYVFSF